MFKYLIALLFYSFTFHAMSSSLEKPYHHITDDKGNIISFRNPEGSPQRDSSFNWSFKVFNEEKKKIKINIPPDHIINKKEVLENLKKYQNNDYELIKINLLPVFL